MVLQNPAVLSFRIKHCNVVRDFHLDDSQARELLASLKGDLVAAVRAGAVGNDDVGEFVELDLRRDGHRTRFYFGDKLAG